MFSIKQLLCKDSRKQVQNFALLTLSDMSYNNLKKRKKERTGRKTQNKTKCSPAVTRNEKQDRIQYNTFTKEGKKRRFAEA